MEKNRKEASYFRLIDLLRDGGEKDISAQYNSQICGGSGALAKAGEVTRSHRILLVLQELARTHVVGSC